MSLTFIAVLAEVSMKRSPFSVAYACASCNSTQPSHQFILPNCEKILIMTAFSHWLLHMCRKITTEQSITFTYVQTLRLLHVNRSITHLMLQQPKTNFPKTGINIPCYKARVVINWIPSPTHTQKNGDDRLKTASILKHRSAVI